MSRPALAAQAVSDVKATSPVRRSSSDRRRHAPAGAGRESRVRRRKPLRWSTAYLRTGVEMRRPALAARAASGPRPARRSAARLGPPPTWVGGRWPRKPCPAPRAARRSSARLRTVPDMPRLALAAKAAFGATPKPDRRSAARLRTGADMRPPALAAWGRAAPVPPRRLALSGADADRDAVRDRGSGSWSGPC
jgi:hypothetical protein